MDHNLYRILSSYNDRAPLEEASTIPATWYTNDAMFQLERTAVFGSGWQVVGRTDQITGPGDYFTCELAGEPLLIVCDNDGTLRAFFNVCRHHAAAVATDPCGKARLFRCPYHGWTYGLDGSLKGTPDFTEVCKFDRSENGLIPVQVGTWEHFIFVSLSKDVAPLHDFIGPLNASAAPLEIRNLRYYSRREYLLNCNWKVFVDNYLDGGYHVPYIHKGLNSVLDYAEYTVENGSNYCLQSSPMVKSEEDGDVGSTRLGDRAYYYWLYPNFMINVYRGVMDTNLVLPLGVDRTLVVFDFYFEDISPERQEINERSIAVSDQVQREDLGICDSVQKGLSSRAYQAGRLSVRREAGEHLFHRLLAKDLWRAASQWTIQSP